MIEYGFESGSQKMLNVINKKVTVKENRDAAIWTDEAGIFTSPALVLAMPGETDETIGETIDFLKSLNLHYKQYQWKYALPIPGAALYEFAKISGAIKDEDEYLSSLTDEVENASVFHVNLTDEPDDVVAGWDRRLKKEMDDYYFKRRYKSKLAAKAARLLNSLELHFRRRTLFRALARKFIQSKSGAIKPSPRFRKDTNINVESLLTRMDNSMPNREASLKTINARLNSEAFVK
jgi:radical SAM superfamily enzyme YgiQ (UPF0313 family)